MSILADLRSRKNWNEVEKNARKVANVNALSNEKVKQKKASQPSGVGFEAIKEFKTYTDLQDPYLIHVINENEQDVFKTSFTQMKIACSMDTDGDHFMHEEYFHFDGNHERVKAFVTLTSSVYHPLLQKQVILATMNYKHENSNYVAEFWHKFNDAYRKVNAIGKNFLHWVTDMATANFSGLSIVYGEDVLTKVKGCEFHYKQSVERKVKTLNTKGEEFRNLALKRLIMSTPEAYSHALRLLETFLSNNTESIRDWIEW